MRNPLFHHKTIKKYSETVKPTSKQIEASRKWLGYLDAEKLGEEKSSYLKFAKVILDDMLGFPQEDIEHEEDNVEFSFSNSEGKKVLCIECKGTKTTELDALQHRVKKEHETPIKQTWDYMGSTGSDYGICTNYKDFVLMTRNGGTNTTHEFNFESIRKDTTNEKLKEFIGIFSKERLIDKGGFVEKLHKESVGEEREFTREFYKLFHQTRLMLIKAFQEKEDITKDEAINYTQLYLNRLIFIFFAEDNNFLEKKLFMERVKKSLNSNVFESSKMVSDQILELFRIMDEGSDRLGIVGFGGGLFQERIPSKIHFLDLRDKKFFNDITSKIKLKIKPDNTIQSLIDRERKLNPIIKNLLIMDSFDFTTDLNVNILGRIFEQSISDLEELKEEKVSRRKKEGVFYTPEEITDYVCRNTIIPYLSKSGANSIGELFLEYENDIEELEKKFREIKILDSACGSGAFLIKAVDILLEIHKEILRLKIRNNPEKYSDNGQTKMDKWNEESEAKKIIENNIYGVDINPESVAITKLALFLKIAERGKKLSELTNNIKVGNSLISDKSIDNAFDWELEFPDIFHDEKGKRKENPGFDVVIGNPPYVRQEKIKELKESLKKKYEIFVSTADLYTYFYEHGVNLLRDNGILGYISSNKFMRAKYGSQLRNFLKHKTSLKIIIDFGDTHMFDAITNTAIVIAKKEHEKNNKLLFSNDVKSEPTTSINQDELDESAWTLADENILNIKKKIEEIGTILKEWDVEINRGLLSGLNEAYLIDTKTKEQLCKEDTKNIDLIKPIIRGRNIRRYFYEWKDLWMIFIPWHFPLENDSTITNASTKAEKQFKAKNSLQCIII